MAVKVPPKPVISEVKPEQPPPEFEGFEIEPRFEVMEQELIPFPAKNIESNRDYLFWEWMETLREVDWNHIMMYLYRELPVIDRQQIDPKAKINIDAISHPWNKNSTDFLTRHGSGKYKVLINDNNKAVKGKGGTIGTVRFEVNDPEYPPVFILEELVVDHPSNKSIVAKLVAEGKLNIEGKVMAQQGGSDNAALIGLLTRLIEQQRQQPQQVKDTTADNIGQMYVKASDSMMNMLKDQVKADDPEKLVKMLSALKEMMPKQDNGSNEMMMMFMKMQMDASAKFESLLMTMLNKPVPEPRSLDSEIDTLIKLKELTGGGEGGGGKRSIYEVAIESGAPVVMKILETVQGFLSLKNYQDGLRKAGVVIPNQPPQHQQQALPPQQQPIQEPKGDNVVEMPKPEDNELIQLIKGPAGPMILGALQRGESGDDFAHSLVGMLGKLTYDKIAAVGKPAMLSAMQAVPEFWSSVVPASIEKFVDEFIAYPELIAKEEEEEDDETIS
jgi:hypothetical protein